MKYASVLREEELKNRVGDDFFSKFQNSTIIGNIDFAVGPKDGFFKDEIFYFWAEAKQHSTNILAMLTQLVLTIGKARTFDKYLPPQFLGCFDCEKIAFIPYSKIQHIFYQNDFNWKVTSSNTNTKEFQQVYLQIDKIINNYIPWESYIFDFEKDEKELRKFIAENFVAGKTSTSKIRIDKNNFINIYGKWLLKVKPTIQIDNWDIAKKSGIIDGDFYLADLLSAENKTLKEKLFVLLKTDHYELDRKLDETGFKIFKTTAFSDNQSAYKQFWAKYERPPLEQYWDYIIDHRHLLVPQDVRERKGSYYTPKIWVELSQKYIADVFGEDWQDEYYIWDCCAGTGNLLAGLTNKYNIWASTLDEADVDVMHDRIENGANLLHDHVFQFDFLNDDFTRLPQELQKIINSEEKRKKLIVYINPPYIEGDARIGKGRRGTQITKIREKYQKDLGKASGELFAQFLIRIYCEIPYVKIANFSTLKNLQSPNFQNFRNVFRAAPEKIFLVPANTFDNVKGQFPIGFFIWNTEIKEIFVHFLADVFDKNGYYLNKKNIYSYDNLKYISDWLEKYSKYISKNYIGHLSSVGNDFQNQNAIFIDDVDKKRKNGGRHTMITIENLIVISIYFAVRNCIKATWINDRDQFLYPNDGWKTDLEFQNDCIAYTLFNNNISSKYGTNHWLPFTEQEVNPREKFESHFMTDFISGKIKPEKTENNLFNVKSSYFKENSREFSPEAINVFNAGKELWKYYHAQEFSSFAGANAKGRLNGTYNVNASLYDIREYFQGRNNNGKMNNTSTDERYNELIGNLRESLKVLAAKIEPKVYEYEFLKK
jgi:hypothetical protein